MPHTNALLYLPTEDDIRQLASNPETQPFWQTILKDEFTLHEEAMRKKPMTAAFNIEYAVLTGCRPEKKPKMINLSNDSLKSVKQVLDSTAPLSKLSILNPDLTLKLDKPPMRTPVGFITRGDYSQARGHGMGLGVIADAASTERLRSLMEG